MTTIMTKQMNSNCGKYENSKGSKEIRRKKFDKKNYKKKSKEEGI